MAVYGAPPGVQSQSSTSWSGSGCTAVRSSYSQQEPTEGGIRTQAWVQRSTTELSCYKLWGIHTGAESHFLHGSFHFQAMVGSSSEPRTRGGHLSRSFAAPLSKFLLTNSLRADRKNNPMNQSVERLFSGELSVSLSEIPLRLSSLPLSPSILPPSSLLSPSFPSLPSSLLSSPFPPSLSLPLLSLPLLSLLPSFLPSPTSLLYSFPYLPALLLPLPPSVPYPVGFWVFTTRYPERIIRRFSANTT